MEFIISSASLLKGILDVSKAIPAKTALPILENFLFVLKNGKLEITASDQELTLRTVVEVTEAASEGAYHGHVIVVEVHAVLFRYGMEHTLSTVAVLIYVPVFYSVFQHWKISFINDITTELRLTDKGEI